MYTISTLSDSTTDPNTIVSHYNANEWKFNGNSNGCTTSLLQSRDAYLNSGVPDDCKHEGIVTTLEDSSRKVYAYGYTLFFGSGESNFRSLQSQN